MNLMTPVTAELIKMIENGVDAVNVPDWQHALQQELADRIYGLSEYEKGAVIIDLLTINMSLGHLLTEAQLPELAP